EARALAERAANDAAAIGVPLGELVARTQLGLALVDASDGPAALAVLTSVRERLDREPMLMGSIWRLPLHIGLSAAHRQRRAWTDAEAEADRARGLAARSGGQTWLALAWTAHAEVARARSELAQAKQLLERAAAALVEADAPLAAWRVHACASNIAAAEGRPDLAAELHGRASSVLQGLHDSLPPSSDLRRSTLAHF